MAAVKQFSRSFVNLVGTNARPLTPACGALISNVHIGEAMRCPDTANSLAKYLHGQLMNHGVLFPGQIIKQKKEE